MDLSNDLISKFVKITNDADKQKTKEGTVYGTAVKYDGSIYVKIDGSDLLTPVDTTADIQDGERVTITIKDHNATVTGNITSPSTNEGAVTKKVTEAVDGVEDKIITEVETLVADRVSTKELDAEVARIDELIAGKATIEDLEVTNATIENLKVKDAEIENLVATKATIGDLTATNATIGMLDAKVANIDTLVNGNLTSDNILSFNITSKNTTMEDAFIKDAMIDRITANKIMSGTIDTNNVVIQSTDGSMLLQGNILQMKDESGKVRIQIGKDTGGNFTFVLYDETGKGVLIDEEGIKSSDAIADGLIVDAKVADNANISGSKLDIASVITEVNNDNSTTIKSSKIYLNEQNQSLEVAFNSLKSQVETIQDVTINGDLSSIVEQVQSNTTKIEANKEGINTLVAENVIRTEEISDLEGELQQVNTTLSNKYASLEQNLDGFKTTVSDTYTTKSEFNNLEVGGRNLVLNSGPMTLKGWSSYNTWSNTLVGCSTSPTGYAIRSVCTSKSYVGGVFNDGCNMGLFVDGDVYTVSAWIRASKACPMLFYFERMEEHTINLSTEWQHYTYTGIYDAALTKKACVFYIPNDRAEANMWFEVHSLKLEKGNKATDWTPAPEDIQANIDAVDGKFANYSTTTQMNSAIQQKANEITSSVSSTYTTKAEFDNLEVGGRNLIIRSTEAKEYCVGMDGAPMQYAGNAISDYISVLPDTIYTFTKTNTAITDGYFRISWHDENKTFISREAFADNKARRKSPMNAYFIRVSYPVDSSPKLEKGNKATDWTPAPEDVQANIDAVDGKFANYSTTTQMNSAIQQKANEITSSVSSTYTTKTEFQNLAIGGRNLIRQSVVSSVSCASSSYDKNTATWTLTANAGSGGSWGAGLLISGDSVRIPYGKTYVLSFEIKVPRACTWNIDVNNYAVTGSSWNGNDNDNGNARATSSKSLVANQWIKCWSRISNTASGNTNKVDIYDFSNFGVVMLNETSNMTFQIRNIQGEIGNIPSDYTPAQEDVQTDIFKAMSNGKMLYTDPMFKQGVNNVGIYNNSSNGTVTVTRIPKVSDCPTTSTHCIEVKTTGTATPGNGGFYQLVQSRANAIYIQKILAKVPTGCNLNTASNSMGTGYTDTWLTSNKGTGKWEEYIREIRCGSTGSFSTGGHVYVSGASPTTSSPLVWYVGMCTIYDITDSDERITDLTTRVSTAESKLTKDSLTTTIGSYYTTSTDVNNAITSKGYATTSQVQQTVDSLSAKFSSSGGYNKLYNTSFINGMTNWGRNGCTASIVDDTNSPTGKAIKVVASGHGKGIYQHYTPNKTGYYTVSFYGRADANMNMYFGQEGSSTKTVTLTTSWQKFSHTFNRTSTSSNAYIFYPSSAGTFYMHSMLVEEGELCGVWSPHPSEIYDGITKIDKNGLQVSQSNYNGYTQMSASGFYVNNGSENVISITKDGSYFKGKVVITSGSTVPTSVLSGTVSSSQLDTSITSDISTAKSNASTAVSTANTASTNASNAVKTANTASTNASNAVSTANTASTNASNAVKTANTASTNASTAVSTANTAKSTADSVKSTVDSGKTNWTNAYNRVNEWAYGAVTGSTTIDGGYIQANTIVSDKIAAGAIIAAKIAAGAVTADKISAGAITADKLAANAITSKTITGSTITGGTISGATITSETLMKTYGGMYVGSEIWGGFKKDSNGNYSSAQTFTIRGSTALQIDGNPTRISSVTGEVKIGDASSYDNLRAREIYAQEIIYTNDLRTRDATQLSLSNVSMRSANASIEFSSGYGVIRVKDRNHLYLQTKGNTGGDTSAEIRCTRYSDTSNYVNIRAYNVCAQNAVYANGVNVSSDINRKRDIELYSTDALHEVCTTPVYTYHLDTDKDEELKRIGIIMQEAPLDAIDLTGKGVDLYQMVTMLWRAVQQQQEIINELKGE